MKNNCIQSHRSPSSTKRAAFTPGKAGFTSGKCSAFTLIELLVVIAIIAILAAILFPVFAQAREKARQTSCLSNMKQMALGITQYAQDYDEIFPIGHQMNSATPWTNGSWVIAIQPYVKSLGVFYCPSDTLAGEPGGNASGWAGRNISYASNGYYSSTWSVDSFPLRGPMGVSGGQDWLGMGKPNGMADMTRPADTILVAEKWSSKSTFYAKNTSGFSPNSVFCGDAVTVGNGWGDPTIPRGTRAEAAYPNGKNGAVTPHNTGFANFAFIDGHAKAMKPIQTNPDPVARPLENLWDGKRK